MQYSLFYSSSDLLHDEVRHRQRLEYIPFISRLLTPTDNLTIILGSKPEKFKTIGRYL